MIKHDSLVLIDGSNFYFKLKELGISSLLEFNISSFLDSFIVKNYSWQATYYIGRIRNDGSPISEQLFSHQRKLLSRLKQHGIRYSLGYLMKIGNSYHEKGVDVQIAVDLVVNAYERTYSDIFLFSSDTDLIPAIRVAQNKKISIHYCGFAHKPSKALVQTCTSSILFTKDQLVLYEKKPAKAEAQRRR